MIFPGPVLLGSTIRRADLDADIVQRLADNDSEAAQRRLHLLWVGLEEALARRLLAKEATRRGIGVEALRDKEILAKLTPPTDAELREFYDVNAERLGVSFETAAPHIKNELTTERIRALERALIERLREQVDIRYTLPVPDLPRQKLELGTGPSWGKPDARVTLVAFSDFECPYCARASAVLTRLKELYPHDLRIEFRDFPLAQHPNARRASEAARCAHEQGKFWEYHDLLFANARALGPADLERYAGEAGLDRDAFGKCLASDRPKKAIDSSLALGQKAGVSGTPALYINGMKLVGLLPLPLFQAIIDRELGR